MYLQFVRIHGFTPMVLRSNYKGDIEGEIADILFMTFTVADFLNVDVEKAFLEKQKKVEQRVYKRLK